MSLKYLPIQPPNPMLKMQKPEWHMYLNLILLKIKKKNLDENEILSAEKSVTDWTLSWGKL